MAIVSFDSFGTVTANLNLKLNFIEGTTLIIVAVFRERVATYIIFALCSILLGIISRGCWRFFICILFYLYHDKETVSNDFILYFFG